MVTIKIYSQEELENMNKEELIKIISSLQTEILSDSVYDSSKKTLSSRVNIGMEDYQVLSF